MEPWDRHTLSLFPMANATDEFGLSSRFNEQATTLSKHGKKTLQKSTRCENLFIYSACDFLIFVFPFFFSFSLFWFMHTICSFPSSSKRLYSTFYRTICSSSKQFPFDSCVCVFSSSLFPFDQLVVDIIREAGQTPTFPVYSSRRQLFVCCSFHMIRHAVQNLASTHQLYNDFCLCLYVCVSMCVWQTLYDNQTK